MSSADSDKGYSVAKPSSSHQKSKFGLVASGNARPEVN